MVTSHTSHSSVVLLCNTDFVCFDEMQDSLTSDDVQANIIKNINKNTLFPYHFRSYCCFVNKTCFSRFIQLVEESRCKVQTFIRPLSILEVYRLEVCRKRGRKLFLPK